MMASTAADSFNFRMGKWRLLVALVVIPLLDAVLGGYVTFPLAWWLWGHGGLPHVSSQQVATNVAIIAGVLGLLILITAALPVSFWLIRRGHTSVRHFTLSGILL